MLTRGIGAGVELIYDVKSCKWRAGFFGLGFLYLT